MASKRFIFLIIVVPYGCHMFPFISSLSLSLSLSLSSMQYFLFYILNLPHMLFLFLFFPFCQTNASLFCFIFNFHLCTQWKAIVGTLRSSTSKITFPLSIYFVHLAFYTEVQSSRTRTKFIFDNKDGWKLYYC